MFDRERKLRRRRFVRAMAAGVSAGAAAVLAGCGDPDGDDGPGGGYRVDEADSAEFEADPVD